LRLELRLRLELEGLALLCMLAGGLAAMRAGQLAGSKSGRLLAKTNRKGRARLGGG